MRPTAGDLSLYIKRTHDELEGMVGAYVDDSIGTGTKQFEEYSKLTEQRFQSKPRETQRFTFAGIEIEPTEDGYILHQRAFASRVKMLPKDCSFSDFRSKRHELAWLVNTRPDISAQVNFAAQVVQDKWVRQDVLNLNAVIRRVQSTLHRGIRQTKLDKKSVHIKVFVDSSFANTPDLKTQLGFIVAQSDNSKRCNILHFTSYKSRRTVRSVMGGELYAFSDGFDYAYLMKHDLEDIFGRRVPLMMLTDSEALFRVVVRSSTTTEKRMMIDLQAAREAYCAQEIDDIGWIRSNDNPADGLTKVKRWDALTELLDTGRWSGEIMQWVIRTPRGTIEKSRNKDTSWSLNDG